MATLYAKAAGGNWSAAATWSNVNSGGGDSSGPPTAADNVIFEAGSGAVTIDAASSCRSLDCTSGTGSYAGTLTHTAGFTLTIGDGTAGAGNVALKLVAGMTYAPSADTCVINFSSTSATQQTITTAGKLLGPVTIVNVGCSYILSDSLTLRATTTQLTVTAGTFDTGNQTVSVGIFSSTTSNVRTITLCSSSITTTLNSGSTSWDFTTSTNMTFNAGTSTVTIAGSSTFAGGGKTYNNIIITGTIVALGASGLVCAN